jgi:hypothetical protein
MPSLEYIQKLISLKDDPFGIKKAILDMQYRKPFPDYVVKDSIFDDYMQKQHHVTN